MVYIVAAILLSGTLLCSAQTGDYTYSGTERTITLEPGLYDITAYGAEGGGGSADGGFGAEMEAQFDFTALTSLTLLVGGSCGAGSSDNSGGGGGSFVINGSIPLIISGYSGGGSGGIFGGGGGGGSYIDSSAVTDLVEISGVASPDDSPNGEIIITSVPEPSTLVLTGLSGLSLLFFRVKRKQSVLF